MPTDEAQDPTTVSPAALAETGVVEIPTEPAEAWSDALDDDVYEGAQDSTRPNWLVPVALLVLAAAITTVAGAVAYTLLRQDRPAAPTAVTTFVPAIATTTSPPVATPPPSARSRAPEAVALSARGDSVYVGTKSGKTACQVTVNYVSCIVQFVGRTPLMYGQPTNVVMITYEGIMDWTIGDGGQLQTRTLDYGTIYHALGWTITPTSEGTSFRNDATSRGMTVNVDGARAF
ncbi:hypothetical protein [Mycobacteroides salmoniphilum]|uniref:hypothetical protein n=1 Tax=Mycobacteroides salmoniphilum TaxID=404941 RepID=UPI0010656C3F|nr:hypothetical protein [Mycobacteroides salmoniphilum]TDZ93363.1 hypothetical protein CCUG62472_02740 [Mycobacteroides salmoniphilum]